MPTFIDESGDTGFSLQGSEVFRLCAVTVPSDSEADAMRAEIGSARTQLKRDRKFEFKFSEASRHPRVIETFLRAVTRHDFQFATVTIRKRRRERASAQSRACHILTTTALAALLRPAYSKRCDSYDAGYVPETVVADNNDDPKYLATLAAAFGSLGSIDAPPRDLVGPICFEDSKREALIQLADMICGVVGQHLEDERQGKGNRDWYEEFKLSKRNLGNFVFQHCDRTAETQKGSEPLAALR